MNETLTEALSVIPRGALALAGGLVCVAGARLYPLVIVAPGFAAGVLAGLALPLDPSSRGIAAVVLGAVGALLCRFVERIAVVGIGAVVAGSVANAVWPLVTGHPAPWWGPAAGALAGLALFPSMFRAMLLPITAVLGAFLVGWSLGFEAQLPLVGGMALVGAIIQFATRKRKDDEDD